MQVESLSLSMPSHHWLQYTVDIMKMFKIVSFCCSLVHQYDALNKPQICLRLSYNADCEADRFSSIQS